LTYRPLRKKKGNNSNNTPLIKKPDVEMQLKKILKTTITPPIIME
jgi:hypothetical protein